MTCVNVPVLAMRLSILKARRARLIRRLADLGRAVNRLESVIDAATACAVEWGGQAAAVLAAGQGIERGRWAYWRGAYDLSVRALEWLAIPCRPALEWVQRVRYDV